MGPLGGGSLHQDRAHDVQKTSTDSDEVVPTLDVGTRVYVRNRFLGDWSGGFEVVEVLDNGYRIRRLSDGQAFLDMFPFADVRLERRQNPFRQIAGAVFHRRH